MRPKLTAVAVALLALLLTATGAAAGDVTDTWAKRRQIEPQGVSGPVPVVLYVHGCNGAGRSISEGKVDTDAWAAAVTGAGWRFVIPDSWARGTWSRPDGCPGIANTYRPWRRRSRSV